MKFRTIVALSMLVIAVGATTGCSSLKRKPVADPAAGVGDDKLLQVAMEIKREMSRINQISSPRSMAQPDVINTPEAPRDFMRIASIDYDGDVEGFLRDLKESGLYEVRIFGRRPTTDLPVSLHHYRQPIWKILEDAGIQLGRFATIAIKPGVIIVNYVNYNQ